MLSDSELPNNSMTFRDAYSFCFSVIASIMLDSTLIPGQRQLQTPHKAEFQSKDIIGAIHSPYKLQQAMHAEGTGRAMSKCAFPVSQRKPHWA